MVKIWKLDGISIVLLLILFVEKSSTNFGENLHGAIFNINILIKSVEILMVG